MPYQPYLFFGGNCREAFTRYHEIFGGELRVMTQGDVPEEARMPGADPASVMHASLTIGEAFLMGSDDPTGDGGPKVGAAVAYSAKDPDTARRVFDALAEGGQVTGEFGPTFWSKGFGMCTDRFGVPWMVDTFGEPAAG